MPTRARPAALIMAVAGSIPATELYVQDLRLVAESRPGDASSTWSDHLGGSSEDLSLSAWAAGAGLRQGWGWPGRPWQLLVGGELLQVRQSATGLSDDGWQARLEAGAAVALRHDLALTLLPAIGWGQRSARITPEAADAIDLAGQAFEVGVRGGLRWQPSLHWSLGAETGWLSTREELDGAGASLELEASGPWFALSLAWIPDPLPLALDRR